MQISRLCTLVVQLRNQDLYERDGALFGVARPPQLFSGVRKHKHTSKNNKLCSELTYCWVWAKKRCLFRPWSPIFEDWSHQQEIGEFLSSKHSKPFPKFVRNKVFCFWKCVCVSWHQRRVVVVARHRTALHSAHPLLSSLSAILMCIIAIFVYEVNWTDS